ncbi:MAG TPA: hypothetical protein VK824_06380 [Planctomycetota bacterium]|nr:hypothetical protein [Planctomycetota bacterium]
MKIPASFRLAFVPALLALIAAHASALADGGPDVTHGKTYLVRPDPVFDVLAFVPDANAKGRVNIETKESTGRDKLGLTISGVDKTLTYNLFIEDPESPGAFSAGIPLSGNGGTKILKLDTDKGDVLPFSVQSLAELEGVELRVVAGTDPDEPATLYLRGKMPALGVPPQKLKAKQKLALASDEDGNAKGTIVLSSTISSGAERLFVHVSKLDFESHVFSLWIQDVDEDGLPVNTFAKAGDFVGKGSNNGVFERFTKLGDPLPAGENSAVDFAGRVVEVRDQTDTGSGPADHAYLSTLVPLLH